MSRQTIKITTTKIRVKKDGSTNSSGYRKCNICHGTGVVKSSGKKKSTTSKPKGSRRR